jgi:hypothetical protein
VAVSTDDLRAAGDLAHRTLFPMVDADWYGAAGSLDWDCRRTLDHLANTLLFYSVHLAERAFQRVPYVRDGSPDTVSIAGLLGAMHGSAFILAALADGAEGVRAFHPAGLADAEGFVAMGCDEVLVHSFDLACGLGVDYMPPDDLVSRVVARLFPWAPNDDDPWTALLWANGRVAREDAARLAPDWSWHCAPLSEWDGVTTPRWVPGSAEG